MPIVLICLAISADAERVKYALDAVLLIPEDGTRRSFSGSCALDAVLLIPEDGTRRSFPGSCALDAVLLISEDGTRRSTPGCGALDEGILLKAEVGTLRSLSGPVESVSVGKSRQRRSGPGGERSSSSGVVSSEPSFLLARECVSRRRLGGHHAWSEFSTFGDFEMTGLIVRVARSSAVERRDARGESGLKAED